MASIWPPSRIRQQDGVALPVSVMTLMLILSLGGLVMQQSMALGDAANREQRSKRAVQAADAGLDVAVFRVSKVATATQQCPVPGGFAAYENVAGELWCPEVQENLGDGKSYTYRVAAPAANGDRRVVSSGTADGATRRVAVTSVKAIQPLFNGFGVSSDSDIELTSSGQIGQMSPVINTHARANGNIVLSSSANICGNAIPGPGKTVTHTSSYGVCPGFSTTPASASIVFPPVVDDVAKTTNDNNRICVATLDPCSPTSDVQWNSSTKTLRMNSSATLTLRGRAYYFCSIQLNSSSRLILDPPSTADPVLIYVGGPADCPGQPEEVIRMNSSSQVFYDDRADRDPFDDAARKSATYRECRPQPTAGQPPDGGC